MEGEEIEELKKPKEKFKFTSGDIVLIIIMIILFIWGLFIRKL